MSDGVLFEILLSCSRPVQEISAPAPSFCSLIEVEMPVSYSIHRSFCVTAIDGKMWFLDWVG